MGIAPVTAFWLALGAIFIKGFMQSMANAPINATLQSSVNPAMQGRVISLVTALAITAAPLGLLFAGPVSARLSISTWFVVLGSASALLGAAGFLFPSLVHLGEKAHHAGIG